MVYKTQDFRITPPKQQEEQFIKGLLKKLIFQENAKLFAPLNMDKKVGIWCSRKTARHFYVKQGTILFHEGKNF